MMPPDDRTAEQDLAELTGVPMASTPALPPGTAQDPLGILAGDPIEDTPLAPIVPPGGAGAAPLQAPPAPASMADQMPLPQNGAPMSIPGAIRESRNVANEGGAQAQKATADEQQALRDQAALDQREADALKPTLDHQQKAADALVQFQQRTVQAYQTAFQNRQLAYEQTQKELDKVRAQMHPTDLFGAANVGPVQGTIAMILGAIGGINDGRNSGVERLDQMAQMRAQQLQQEANLIGKKGQMQENMFGFAREKLGDDQGAYLATYQAQLEGVKAETQQVSNNFRSPRAQAAARSAIAALDQKLAAVQTQMGQFNSQMAMQGTIAMANNDLERQKMALSAATAQRNQLGLDGFVGSVAEGTHKQLAEKVGGARAFVGQLDGLKDVLDDGASPEAIRAVLVDNAMLTKFAKDYMATGANIDKTERMVMEALASGKPENFISLFAGTSVTHQVAQMERVKRDIALGLYSQVRAGNPNIQVDTQDPVFGPVFAKEMADQQARAERKQARAALSQGTPHQQPDPAPTGGFGGRVTP